MIESEPFFEQPETTYGRVLDFLGLPPVLPDRFDRWNGRPSSPMPDDDAHPAARALQQPRPSRWPRCWDGSPHGCPDRSARACPCGPTTRGSCAGTGVLIGALMGIGLLAGFAWSLLQPSTFSATASIALVPVPKLRHAVDHRARPARGHHRHRRPAAAQPAGAGCRRRRARHGPGRGRASDLSVTASPNSHVLHVTVTAVLRRSAPPTPPTPRSPRSSTSGATRSGRSASDQLRQLRLLVSRPRSEQLAKQQTEAARHPGDRRPVRPDPQLRASLDELEEARRAARRGRRARAAPRRARDYANTEVPMVSGAMLGLLAGCLLGAGRDRLGCSRSAPAFAHELTHPSGRLPDRRHPSRGQPPCQLSTHHPPRRVSTSHAVRHHLAVVLVCLVARWPRRLALRRPRAPTTYTSTRPGAGEPVGREPVRAHAVVGAAGRADQPARPRPRWSARRRCWARSPRRARP